MVGIPGGRATLAFAMSMMLAVPAPRAVDLHLFADPAKACAYLATAGVEDIARVEILLAILQRDMAGGEGRYRLMSARDDVARLDGDARTVEHSVSAIEAQIVQGHVLLRTLRDHARAADLLTESQAGTLRAEIRATSEELIELSLDLRDAKDRLSALRTAMAGRRDGITTIDAAQSTARLFDRVIRDCATERRASLSGALEMPSPTCDMPAP